jgi:hypothetical protein
VLQSAQSTPITYVGKWITGDYDLMDVIGLGDKCERSAQK